MNNRKTASGVSDESMYPNNSSILGIMNFQGKMRRVDFFTGTPWQVSSELHNS